MNRLTLKNSIVVDIKRITLTIERNDEKIDRLKKDKTTFNLQSVEKSKSHNKELNEKLNVLKQKIIDIERGLFDDEILKSNDRSLLDVEENKEKVKKINKDKELKKIEEKKNIEKFYFMNKKKDGYNDLSDSQIKYETNRYFKNCDAMPEYLKRNLSEMPSNKGYIWRDMWCFGSMPEEVGKPVTMFEKCGDTLYITEITKTERKYYEKFKQNKKRLISVEKRVPIVGSWQ